MIRLAQLSGSKYLTSYAPEYLRLNAAHPRNSSTGLGLMSCTDPLGNALYLPIVSGQPQCHVAKVDLAICAGHRRGVTRVTAVTGVISGRGCCCVAESGPGDSRDAGRLGGR